MAWNINDMDAVRNGYAMRSFFNAGLNRETLVCDEEGTDIYDEETLEYIGSVSGIQPSELMDMDDAEFEKTLEENGIY